MRLKLQKIVAAVAGAIFVVAWFADGALQNEYVYYPRHPVISENKIVMLAVKGIVVYITPSQRFLLSSLTWIEIASVLIVAIIFLVHGGDPFKSKR